MKVEFALPAEFELADGVDYYNLQRPDLGDEFARDVYQAVMRIAEYPNAWQNLGRGVRRCQLARFEYGLVYRVRGDIATV